MFWRQREIRVGGAISELSHIRLPTNVHWSGQDMLLRKVKRRRVESWHVKGFAYEVTFSH